jgi:hypothetical protein
MPCRMFVYHQYCFGGHGQCIHPMDHSSILLRRQEILTVGIKVELCMSYRSLNHYTNQLHQQVQSVL